MINMIADIFSSAYETPAKVTKGEESSSGAASLVATPTLEIYSQDTPWYHSTNTEVSYGWV